jgi:hypothetical protein
MNSESATFEPGPGATCHDCGAEPGQLHRRGCDVEPCPYCGGQALFCPCDGIGVGHAPDDDRLPWTGEWPGTAECRAFGWYCRWGQAGRGWVRCGPGDPGATEDLNRLRKEARWDRGQKRWLRKAQRRRARRR